jgi:hypothetical protein
MAIGGCRDCLPRTNEGAHDLNIYQPESVQGSDELHG